MCGTASCCPALKPACCIALSPPFQSESALGAMVDQVVEMERAQAEAARHSALVHAVPWVERAAGELRGYCTLVLRAGCHTAVAFECMVPVCMTCCMVRQYC